MPRKKICKIVIGSHLYGLATETSDRDYAGVYLPSARDILGLDVYPIELIENEKTSEGPRNTSADIDCKYFSLRQFMRLAAEGQSAQLEMLYAKPQHHVQPPDPHWQTLVDQRTLFLSRKTFVPFVRFALAQATKATLKGENLKFIRELLSFIPTLPHSQMHEPIRSQIILRDNDHYLGPVKVEISTNEFGAELLTLAHRRYDTGANLKRLYDSLKILESKYGTRSQSAADKGLDYKSLSHAYRMIFEAEEMLSTGSLTLPLPDKTREFVKAIKLGVIPAGLNWETDIMQRVNYLEHVLAPKSNLPDSPDWEKIEELHAFILRSQLGSDPFV
ncbi:MAG: hypothetical protein EOP04_04675 [Proteobacteria bacterium]|nr:MAG: hypothetical protein EOP04_04675 [Pseudomonadota bacterium]